MAIMISDDQENVSINVWSILMFRSNAPASDYRSAVKAPKPLSFAYLGQGIALGRHNAIGFNNYPDDKPVPPYFTGRLGYLIREGFVRYLAAATQRPGIFVWLGKRRYEHAQRRQQAQAKKHAMQLLEYDDGAPR
jgi:hypothetical protein